MGVTLQLRGTYPKTAGLIRRAHLPPQKRLAAAQEWFEHNAETLCDTGSYPIGPNTHALGVSLHPASEPLEITCGEGGLVEASTKTSTTGPGYHAHVCDLLKSFAREMNVTWDNVDDQTGYFATGEFAGVEQAMFKWVRQVAEICLDHVAKGYREMAISMPTEFSYHHDGAIGTVMGPRSERWLREVLDHPPRGGDMFPWRHPGTGASYLLGRAITLMWTEVRWVKPFTDGQTTLLASVLEALEKAHALDRSLNYPWREWAEIASLLGRAIPLHVQSGTTNTVDDLMGYRRRDVTARPIGEWSIEVPGHFDQVRNDNGSWQTYDESRAIYLNELILRPKPGDPLPSGEAMLGQKRAGYPAGSHRIDHRTDRVVGYADILDSGYELSGLMAVPGRMCVCTINAPTGDGVWAEATWRSLTHPTVEV